MSALLESLAKRLDDSFDDIEARRTALDAVLRGGLPKPRSEKWKYTSLRALERRAFAAPAPAGADSALIAGIPAPRFVFVNGWFDADLSDFGDVPHLSRGSVTRAGLRVADATPDDVFDALNGVLAMQGASLHVPAGIAVDVPVHLVHIGAPTEGDEAWHMRHSIELADGASLSVVEHHLADGPHANLETASTQIVLGAGAQLTHVSIQATADGATRIARTEATLADDARYRRLDLELGGALSRHEFGCRLAGANAAVQADGVLLGTGRRHIDTRLNIDHAVGDTRCDLTWRGRAADRSRVVLHGGIGIRAGADGSNATLSSRNLLLSENAEIDAQPVLEIFADEVQAAHGAAVGGLDPTALFYLRSRGLPEADARRLLTAAFCRDVLGGLDDTLRPFAETALDRALAALDPAA
ncbi:MAG: Fe-S cluster assembly protein SufD [Lysobacter sp.]|nr:Fe-S cluster assembly protein SufD [Lysobacter sp.]